MDKSFPPPTPYKKKTRLIILDRSIDKITPLMHDIGYQSLVHELMHVEHDKIHYISKPSDDGEEEEAEKLCVMNDADEVWMRLRHEFVAKAFQRIGEDMKEFKKEYPDTDMLGSSGNSSSGSSGNTKTTASLDKLKELIFTAPEFLRRKQLVYKH